ncbi:MAG: GTPase HflX [Thermofilaceae archaeon]|jgi:GTP-binding protein HflX
MRARVILVQRVLEGERCMLHELRALAEAAGYEIAGELTQKRPPDSRYNIGRGKVEELKELVSKTGASKVIFFNLLKPNQVYHLRKELGVEVIDRYELILEIFAKRAGSKEAKLQIELARLKRELSFAREYINLQKRGELHGFMGGGRYAVDAYYEYVVSRISRIEESLRALRKAKSMRWLRRREAGLFSIALTGYTGAGKTTLFNRLTAWRGYIDGKPFATLSTKTKLADMLGMPVLVSDTIGFIDSLPEQLFDAFYTTLGEISYADLVLFLVDASEPPSEVERKVIAGMAILSSLSVQPSRVLIAANKVDSAQPPILEVNLQRLETLGLLGVVPLSARTGYNLDALQQRILESLPDRVRKQVKIPSTLFEDAMREIGSKCRVLNVAYDGSWVDISFEGKEKAVERILRKFGMASEYVNDPSLKGVSPSAAMA